MITYVVGAPGMDAAWLLVLVIERSVVVEQNGIGATELTIWPEAPRVAPFAGNSEIEGA